MPIGQTSFQTNATLLLSSDRQQRGTLGYGQQVGELILSVPSVTELGEVPTSPPTVNEMAELKITEPTVELRFSVRVSKVAIDHVVIAFETIADYHTLLGTNHILGQPHSEPAPDSQPATALSDAAKLAIKRSFDKRLMSELQQLAETVFEQLSQQLQRDAVSPYRTPEQQDLYFEGMRQINKLRPKIQNSVLQDIVKRLKHDREPVSSEPNRNRQSVSLDTLDLIDLRTFEESLLVKRYVLSGEQLHQGTFECLLIRYAWLLDAAPKINLLPISPSVLLPSLNRSLDQPDLPPSLSRPLFEYSAEILFRALPTLYATLNRVLRDQGILTTLEQDQSTYGSLLPRVHPQAPEPRHPRHRPTRDTKAAQRITSNLQTDTELDWVSLKVPPAQVNLLQQLMQSMPAATNFETFADVFVSGLFARTDKLAGADHPLRPAMHRLEQTFKAFARSDPSFITDTEHPARKGLDTLFGLSTRAHWAGPSSDTQTQTIVARLQQLTSVEDFVSSDIQDQLSGLLTKARSRFERNIQRVRDMELGRTRYLDAKRRATQQLTTLVGSNAISTSFMTLIESALVELFTLNILQPSGSDEFADIESAVGCLAKTLNTIVAGNALSEGEFETANQQLALLEEYIDQAFPTRVQLHNLLHSVRQEIETQTAEPASAKLSQALDIGTSPLSLEERLDFLPRLKRGVSHALRLSDGLWFNWRSAQGTREKRFLTWIDPGKQRFVFTDHRGYHAETIGLIPLARRIGRTITAENPIETLPASNQYLLSQLTEFTPILDSHIERDNQTGLLTRDSFHRQIELSMKQSDNQGRCLHLVAVRLNNSVAINHVFDSVVADTLDQRLGRQLSHLPSNLFIGGRLTDRDWGVICFEGSAARLRQRLNRLVHTQHGKGIELNNELIEAEVSCIVIDMDIEASEQTCITPILEFLDQTSASKGVQSVTLRKLIQQDLTQPEPGLPFQSSNYELWSEQARYNNRASNDTDVRWVFSVRPVGSSHALDCTELPQGIEQQRALDLWRLRAVLSWLKTLADQSIECPHCVIDVSSASLLDSQFTDHLLDALSDYGVGTRRLWLRLDLSFSETDFRSVTEFAQTMNDIGCRLVGYNLAMADIALIQTLEITHIEYNDPDLSAPPPGLAQRLDIVKLLGIPLLRCSIPANPHSTLISNNSYDTEIEPRAEAQ